MIVNTPNPPYYSVIFTSLKKSDDGYQAMAVRMMDLASRTQGFIGMESAKDELNITVSYWTDLASIKAWKNNAEHLIAQELGREKWYDRYKTRIALVERDYGHNL